jgi:hypothetical protein
LVCSYVYRGLLYYCRIDVSETIKESSKQRIFWKKCRTNVVLNVVLFLDVCHMIKLIRNTLGDLKTLVDNEGQTIS